MKLTRRLCANTVPQRVFISPNYLPWLSSWPPLSKYDHKDISESLSPYTRTDTASLLSTRSSARPPAIASSAGRHHYAPLPGAGRLNSAPSSPVAWRCGCSAVNHLQVLQALNRAIHTTYRHEAPRLQTGASHFPLEEGPTGRAYPSYQNSFRRQERRVTFPTARPSCSELLLVTYSTTGGDQYSSGAPGMASRASMSSSVTPAHSRTCISVILAGIGIPTLVATSVPAPVSSDSLVFILIQSVSDLASGALALARSRTSITLRRHPARTSAHRLSTTFLTLAPTHIPASTSAFSSRCTPSRSCTSSHSPGASAHTRAPAP